MNVSMMDISYTLHTHYGGNVVISWVTDALTTEQQLPLLVELVDH